MHWSVVSPSVFLCGRALSKGMAIFRATNFHCLVTHRKKVSPL